MSYFITKEGRGGINLFLVDRCRIRNKWWSSNKAEAIIFEEEKEAEERASKLRYGNITVVGQLEAAIMDNENDAAENEHIFSSEGLGQW